MSKTKNKKRISKSEKRCNENKCTSHNKDDNKGNDESSTPTSKLCSFGYVDYIVLASTLAIALAEELDTNDLSILAGFFATLSDELALITSVKSCTSNTPDDFFIPPVPDVALTRNSKKFKNIKKK